MQQFEWLQTYGLNQDERRRLLSTVPGSPTDDHSYYVNSLLPDRVFKGRTYATIPMTPGRWFLIPMEIVESHPRISASSSPLATARSAFEWEGPRSIQEWTTGG
ncbi:MAG TPA: hypothetical protein VFB34_06480 [Chloroflexota bacterium]|nr:hypothetical protein [Chloroflexota bacterium]